MRVRTPAGSGLWLPVKSFRRFLAESEAHHVQDAANHGLLLHYTAWAVALGEADRWTGAVAGSIVDRLITRPVLNMPSLWMATRTASTYPASTSDGDSGSTSSSGSSWNSSRSSSGSSSGGSGSSSGGGGGGSW